MALTPLDQLQYDTRLDSLSDQERQLNLILFTSITSGLGFETTATIISNFDQNVPKECQYYSKLDELIISALNLAKLSCEQCLRLSSNEKCAALDGSWSKEDSAPYCIVDMIDPETGKITDFQIVTNDKSAESIQHTNLTFDSGTPKGFEHTGIEKIADRPALQNGTKYYVHDNDVQATSEIIHKRRLNICERLDPNHTAKNLFRKCWESTNPLYGLQGILSGKFLSILKHYEGEERGKKYREFYHQVLENWEYKDDTEKCNALLNKINEAAASYDALDTKFHTNYNESFHHIRNKYAPKYTYFGKSWILRVCCAIIHWNHPGNSSIILRNFFGAPFPRNSNSLKYLTNRLLKKQKDKQRRQTKEFKKKEGSRRFYKKRINKTNKPGNCLHANKDGMHDKTYINVTKSRVFGKTKLAFPPAWQKKTVFIQFPNNDSMESYMKDNKPFIYRSNRQNNSAILIPSKINGTHTNRFNASIKKDLLFSDINDDNIEEVLEKVPLSEHCQNHEDANAVEQQIKEREVKKAATKTHVKIEIKKDIKKEPKSRKKNKRNTSSKDSIVHFPNPQLQSTSNTSSDSSCGSSPSIMKTRQFSHKIVELESIDDPKSEPHPLNLVESNDAECSTCIHFHSHLIHENTFMQQQCVTNEEEDVDYSISNHDIFEYSDDYYDYYEYYDISDDSDDCLNLLEEADKCVRSENFDAAHLLYTYLLSKNEDIASSAMILDLRCFIFEKGEFAALEEIKQKTEFFTQRFIIKAMTLCISSDVVSYLGIYGIENFHDIEIFSMLHDYFINNHDFINALQLTYQYYHIFPLSYEKQIVLQKRFESEHCLNHIEKAISKFQHNTQYNYYIKMYSYKTLKPLSTKEQLAVNYLNFHSRIDKSPTGAKYLNGYKKEIMTHELDRFLAEIRDCYVDCDNIITVDMVVEEIMNCKL